MAEQLDRLKAALADCYAIEREIGAGGSEDARGTECAQRTCTHWKKPLALLAYPMGGE